MPRVKIPPPYQGPTQGQDTIDVLGSTVRECIEAVGQEFPGFAEQVFDAAGNVHRFVTLFINGDEIDRAAVDTAVAASDEVEILAAIAGG
jgi:molybdopterin converting factor small subunit